MSDEESNLALVVVANSITEGRIRSVLERNGWDIEVCNDGDKAVDEYVRLRPDLTFLALDLPSMDGHIAALEIRESHFNARIAFVTSKSRMETAEDAAYSAGAVATLVTPLTKAQIDEKWDDLMGEIPAAPGLADLDALYPEIEEPEPVMPPLPPMPAIPQPPVSAEMIEAEKPKKRGKRMKLAILFLLLSGAGAGVAHYLGYIDVNEILEPLLALV